MRPDGWVNDAVFAMMDASVCMVWYELLVGGFLLFDLRLYLEIYNCQAQIVKGTYGFPDLKQSHTILNDVS